MNTIALFLFCSICFIQMISCNQAVLDCIIKDDDLAGFVQQNGITVDDMDVLRHQFEYGMTVTAINYCAGKEDGELLSVQVVMSKRIEDESGTTWGPRMPLRKFGTQGGTCYRWNLIQDDYIRMIEFTFGLSSNDV